MPVNVGLVAHKSNTLRMAVLILAQMLAFGLVVSAPKHNTLPPTNNNLFEAAWNKPTWPVVYSLRAMSEAFESIRVQLIELLPRLRRFARNLARQPDDADDIVQIALERALSRCEQWDASSRLDSWMFGIIRNAWIDEVRSRQRRGPHLDVNEMSETIADSHAAMEIEMMSVQAAMAQLPEEQRTAVSLVLVEGLSYKEAAQVMEIPIGTLTSRLARGREALQVLLGGKS